MLKHYYYQPQIIICVNTDINLEILNLLYILTRKYSFFTLRRSETQNTNTDLEQDYLLDFNLGKKVSISDTCLLIGVNPRYEGFQLNLMLRSRYLKGNFKVLQVGSLVNLTFSTTNITSNTKILKSLVEGNSLFCQELANSSNPVLISNADVFKRKDSFGLTQMLRYLNKYVKLFSQSKNQNNLNILNSTLNNVGFANFNNIKSIQNKDLQNAIGIYFINNSFLTSNTKKLLSLKLLNFFQDYKSNNKMLITQNNRLNIMLVTQLKNNFNLNTHLHLPNAVFFEDSGTYLSTTGTVCKTAKIIKPLGQTKNDWQIIRKLFSYCKKNLFITNFLKKNKLTFNSETFYHFTNYIGFQFYAISNLNHFAFSFFGMDEISEPELVLIGLLAGWLLFELRMNAEDWELHERIEAAVRARPPLNEQTNRYILQIFINTQAYNKMGVRTNTVRARLVPSRDGMVANRNNALLEVPFPLNARNLRESDTLFHASHLNSIPRPVATLPPTHCEI